MAIKRYTASEDNTITNAFKHSLTTRGYDANMGASDILEVFSIYGQATTSSVESAKILLRFPITDITADRTSGDVPASGNVNFYLRMYNAKHSQTLPRDYKLVFLPVSQSWNEGGGVDMDEYKDVGFPSITGSTWMTATFSNPWHTPGGDYYTKPVYTQTFQDGPEDIEVDITSMVEEWIAGTKTNYGLGVHLTGTQEAYVEVIDKTDLSPAPSVQTNAAGAKRSYYTKKFHGRNSEFFFKRPVIEARWDNKITDDRTNFYYSSSLADNVDNLHTIYLYNYVKGTLKNIKGIGTKVAIYVSLFSGSVDNSVPIGSKLTASADIVYLNATIPTNITGGYAWQGTGIYSASFALTGNTEGILTKVFDVWHNGSGSVLKAGTVQYATGAFNPIFLSASMSNPNSKFVVSMPDLQTSYDNNENVRFRVKNRLKYWQPNNYAVASAPAQTVIVESASFKVYRVKDDLEIVKHSTGSSDNETYMSYDGEGNFFDLDMKILEPDVAYGFEYAYYDGNKWTVQNDRFKFRVEKKE
jgi:hypothetical protein